MLFLFFQTENSDFSSKCWGRGYTSMYYQLTFNPNYFFPTEHLHLGFLPPVMLANVFPQSLSLGLCLQRWGGVVETFGISRTFLL